MTPPDDSPQAPDSRRADLALRQVGVALGQRSVLDGIDLEVPVGSMTALLGPNGAGKTTLLRAIAGLLPLSAGQITIAGHVLSRLDRHQAARWCAYLPQSAAAAAATTSLSVVEAVMTARYPYVGLWGRYRSSDLAAVEEALDAAGVADLADRPLATLSGGQRQRALLARALAQQTPVLLLDEPLAALDIAWQLDTLARLAELAHRQGRTVIVALHDLALAGEYFGTAAVIRAGRLCAYGPVPEVLVPSILGEVFGVAPDASRPGRWRRVVPMGPVTRAPIPHQH